MAPNPAIDPDDMARRIGFVEATPSPEQMEVIRTAIIDAQADVVAYLGQPVTPTTTSVQVAYGDNIDHVLRDYTYVRDVAYTADPALPGYTTVTFVHGIDLARDEFAPIARYLRYAVLNDPTIIRLWQDLPGAKFKRIRSASTEGQNVTYDFMGPDGRVSPTGQAVRAAAADAVDSGPSLSSLDYWRIAGRRISQAVGYASDPLPRWDVGWGYGGPW